MLVVFSTLQTKSVAQQDVNKLLDELSAREFKTRETSKRKLKDSKHYKAVIDKLTGKDCTAETRNACLEILDSWKDTVDPEGFQKIKGLIESIDVEKQTNRKATISKLRSTYFVGLTEKQILAHLKSKGALVTLTKRDKQPDHLWITLADNQWKGKPYDFHTITGRNYELDVDFSRVYDTRLLNAIAGDRVKRLSIFQTTITELDCKLFKKCTNIESLYFKGVTGCQSLYPVISKLEHLKLLWLPNDLTDSDLTQICSSKSITRLEFGEDSNRITKAGLESLASLKSLGGLDLKKTAINVDDLAVLARCKKLEGLAIIHTKDPDGAMKVISKLDSLRSLTITESAVTNRGLSYLSSHKNLNSIYLGSESAPVITDEGFEHLAKIESLKQISNYGALISYGLIKKLRKQKLQVFFGERFRIPDELTKKQVEALKKLYEAGFTLKSNRRKRLFNLELVAKKPLNESTIELLNQFATFKDIYVEFSYTVDDKQAELILKLPEKFKIWISGHSMTYQNRKKIKKRFNIR